MTISLINQSELCINIYIGELQIVLPCEGKYIYTCSFDHMPIEIKMSISNTETCSCNENAICLNISTVLVCDFIDLTNPTLIIKKISKNFQNYTKYQYLTVDSFDLSISDTKHIVDNPEILKNIDAYMKGHKSNRVLYVIKESLIDMLLDGLLPSALLAWIFSWKIAIATLFAIFLIALIINFVKSKTSKSKYRIFNWVKDMNQPDDIEYFIKHIEKYCD